MSKLSLFVLLVLNALREVNLLHFLKNIGNIQVRLPSK